MARGSGFRRALRASSRMLGAVLLIGVSAQGDTILLRGGGQIQGIVLPEGAPPRKVLILTETGSRPLQFDKDRIQDVIHEPGPLHDYLARKAQTPETASAQYELGQWCEQHKLKGLAQVHFERAAAADAAFGPAHQKLGHIQLGDHWVTKDEYRKAQGLVRYRGKWISPEEKERLVAAEAVTAEQASWTRRIRVLHQALRTAKPERAQEAEQQLLAIQDPAAVPGLVQVLGRDDVPVRLLLAQILGGIPGPEAATALIRRIVVEPDHEILQATMDQLARREDPGVIPQLLRGLKSENLQAINRSAWALAELHAVATVPKLIPALVRVEDRLVMESSQDAASAGGGMGMNVGFSSVGTRFPGYLPMTYPVVGPGVVAYGASAVPFGAFGGTGLQIGSSGYSRPQTKFVRIYHKNVEVLRSLERLTGRNFGYDIPTWQRWVTTSFRINNDKPARRAPQP